MPIILASQWIYQDLSFTFVKREFLNRRDVGNPDNAGEFIYKPRHRIKSLRLLAAVKSRIQGKLILNAIVGKNCLSDTTVLYPTP